MSATLVDTITGVILAGGKSSRMGCDKALLQLGDKTFVEQIAGTLHRVVTNVIVIADHREQFEFLHLPVYEDVFKNCGPLGGIHSSFKHTETQANLVVSCDMPLIDPSSLSLLLNATANCDVSIFSSPDVIQPFPGLYRRSGFSKLEHRLLHKKYSVAGFIDVVNSCTQPIPLLFARGAVNSFTHINIPSDYDTLQKEFH
jgi:molybdenum cofactor guanylyltransferase